MLEVLASTTTYLSKQTQTYEINRIRIGKQDTKLSLFIEWNIYQENPTETPTIKTNKIV